ncbi:MAG TPA: SDR family oxidoreductase [Stellaceae bacterium]|jgi:NAD(P)-dependent dehydrogenase (short-subunit alcohol dehydrogenase family)|nr:SDR family oxidoreductase [Stellaceae bacterium]
MARAAGPRRGVLVTGAARRVGAAIARGLVEDGWLVVVHYHNSAADAAALAASLNGRGEVCFPLQADLSRRGEVDGLVGRANAALAKAGGKLTCLVNNASPFVYDNLRSLSWQSWNDHLVPGLAAPLFLAKYFAESIGAGETGLIINMLDQKIDNLNPDFLSYTVSKVGLAGATRMLALALAPRIRVCGIAPGIMLPSGKQSTEQFEAAWRRTPLGRNATVEEIVLAVRFIIESPSATGNIIVLDGGESLMRRGRDIAFDS